MTLTKDLSRFEIGPKDNPYEEYFLLENPFPGYGEPKFEVCTDQEELKNKFVSTLTNFSTDAKRLRINGESGAGKTNILQYFEKLTDEARRNRLIKNLHPIYVSNPGESYYDIHGQIIDRLSELFLGDLFELLKSDPEKIDTLSKNINSASEFLDVIKALVKPKSDQRTLNLDLFIIYSERHKDVLIRWLKGQKLPAADKKLLTVLTVTGEKTISDITSPSLAMRFLNGLLAVLKELNLCDGIILLFDEFEEIFEGLPRSRQSRYAQDLRHLFDTLTESVFFVVATVPNPKDLAQYPAIERRLGEGLAIQAIDSPELAINYVSDYLNNGRDKFKEHGNQPNLSPDDLTPLTKEGVEEEYFSLKKEVEEAELDVLPGYFLPRMRERIKQNCRVS